MKFWVKFHKSDSEILAGLFSEENSGGVAT